MIRIAWLVDRQYTCSWCGKRLGIAAATSLRPVVFVPGWVVVDGRIEWRKPHHRGTRISRVDPATGRRERMVVDLAAPHNRSLPTDLPIVCRCGEIVTLQ